MDSLRRHIEAITPISDEEFAYVESFFTTKRVRKHQFLLHEGDEVPYDYFVVSGIYKVYYLDPQGKEYIVQFAQENWWMTDYNAFFRQQKTDMYIECLEEGDVYCLTLHAREQMAAELHKMEHFFRMKLTHGYMALQKRIRMLLSSSPQQRYEAFAKLYPSLLQKISKKLIAEYLGVSRETLSRLHHDK
ncbi:Crp/Fnr family transcriptional regulator [Flavobacterium terrisoli]|uniref:Crp/Fnr family transcriptional regulator n=1 Tax=Flavobacterium terrisoli TaxID=3242195 RepID=UPI0025426E5C|nr:Crp/Fnr family transcriptional regulator [Flavobacterium buctense]